MPVELTETRHFQITQELREEVRKLPPAEALPTQRELRLRYNVSQATLDRALSQLQQEGLVYRPAGRQRLIRAEVCDTAVRRVAIIRPDYPSEVYESIAQAVVAAGRLRDWSFEICSFRSETRLELMRAMGVCDAAVLMLTSEDMPRHLKQALERPRKPVVVVQEQLDGVGVSSVSSDDAGMAELAVEHLAGLGHKHIGILVPHLRSGPMREALAGWRRAMDVLGLDASEDYLIDAATPPFRRSVDCAYRSFRDWLNGKASKQCTALYATTLHMTLGAMRALRERGFAIPEDFSIVGADGMGELGEYLHPPLTAVTYSMSSYGKQIIDILASDLGAGGSPDGPVQTLIPPYLITRESTAHRPHRNQ